jgi:RimJ/RimL family protein N-acetyltransferase
MTRQLTDGTIVLRPLAASDAAALHIAQSDPEVRRYWSAPPLETMEDSEAEIVSTLGAALGAWVIVEPGFDEALGRIAVFPLRDGVGELGVFTRRAAQGRGYTGRALRLVIDEAFGPLGLHRLVADVDDDNMASLRLFERCGFQREGLLIANWRTHIGLRNSVILGLVKPGAI